MLTSVLIGLAGGQRALTPLAAYSIAFATGVLKPASRTEQFAARPFVAAVSCAMAVAELVGDKQQSAPDRIVPAGLFGRFATSATVGGLLAPREGRVFSAFAAGTCAILASYPGWRLRIAAMKRYGQVTTGLCEDAIVIAGTFAIMKLVARARVG